MTNHIHLIAMGRRPDSLARKIGLAHMRDSRWINKQRGSHFPGAISDWSDWLAGTAEADSERFDLLRRNTATGRPSGSAEFVRRLENDPDRLLRPQRRGRQPRVDPCELTPDLFDSA